ncbi:hypothetical protein MGSAQ_000553, partial [marine sediment metagenome]
LYLYILTDITTKLLKIVSLCIF